MEVLLLCVASNQMDLSSVIITLGTLRNVKDLELSSSLNIAYLARRGSEGSGQIIDSILDTIGS